MPRISTNAGTVNHPVATREKWLDARKALLREEKAFFRKHDLLKAKRRALPWVKIDKTYLFDGPDGRESLADLFAGKSQLLVYHFMFSPKNAAGCPHCSFWADHYDGTLIERGMPRFAIFGKPQIEALRQYIRARARAGLAKQ